MTPEAADILEFWFQGDPDGWRQAWFTRDDAFDAEIRGRFGALLPQAAAGRLDHWADTPEGALALSILLDQFPRNLHRGSPLAFATDAKARALARRSVLERRFDLSLAHTARVFLYLPFEHGESMEDQDLSVTLFEGLRDCPMHRAPGGTIDYAWRHREVIACFGRFPHRNAALGRESTAAELAWLATPGSGF